MSSYQRVDVLAIDPTRAAIELRAVEEHPDMECLALLWSDASWLDAIRGGDRWTAVANPSGDLELR